MNKFIIVAALVVSTCAWAGHYVHGYTRSNGTYVQGHYSSNRDATVTNNYNYRGNTNPYSGSTETDRYSHDTTSPYYQGPSQSGQSGHSSDGLDGNGLQQPTYGYGYNNGLNN